MNIYQNKFFKMKKIVLMAFVVLLQIACQEKSEKESNLLNGKKVNVEVDENLTSTLEAQEELKSQIIALSRKKDSLLNVLKSTNESMSRINEGKIDKGIEGVNMKLNELKGQKENFQEQTALQKKEMELAAKKVELLTQEKIVYDQQKKALWDKGAPPKDFIQVDSLLNGINSKISEQNKRVKQLRRNVADVEEQMLSIDDQRNFLSTKIRENYNAQEIFGEFAKEEETKIKAQIAEIDAQLTKLNSNVNSLNSTIADLNDDIKVKNQMESDKIVELNNAEKTKNRLMMALIFVVLIGLSFGVLYYVGKRNKNKKNKK